MSTVYGTNSDFDVARTVVASQLTALQNAMILAGTDPRINSAAAAIYSTHLGDPALVFNSVSIGIPTIDMAFPAMKSSPAGAVINMLFHVDLRVMIGNSNAYNDEVKTLQICNSIVNWLETHRNMGSNFVLWETQGVESGVRFEDTDTVGGLIKFTMRITEAYVAA
jgi:hypothetical protein